MPNKTCRRITIRLYNPEIIAVIENVPKGFRSAMVQSALAAYIEAGQHRALLRTLQHSSEFPEEEPGDAIAQLTGDF